MLDETSMRIVLIILLASCAGEPIEASQCEDAAATLERCTGQVPEGFRDACDAAPEIASSVIGDVDAAHCPDLGRSDVGKSAFVDACTLGINAGYWIVWARSESSKPLPHDLREKLRPWVGDLVDTTRISWGSSLLTRWRILGHDVILDDDTAAQTFGTEIFFHDAQTLDNRQIALVGHELAHAGQYRDHGGVIGFARAYCAAFYDADYTYRSNALEQEAYDLQYRIRACLDTGRDCP